MPNWGFMLLVVEIRSGGNVYKEQEARSPSKAGWVYEWTVSLLRLPQFYRRPTHWRPKPHETTARYTPGKFPLPSENQSAEYYKTASRMLSEAGYNHYEINSYSKRGFQCKHNPTYWKGVPFYAFGLGYVSYIGGIRFSRPKKLKEYTSYVENLEKVVIEQDEDYCCDAKDMAMDAVMLSLRTSMGLELKSFVERFGSSLSHSLCTANKPYVESGHVVCLDQERRPITAERFSLLISDECKIEETVTFIRLSDPDGFLLSNELISLAFRAIAP